MNYIWINPVVKAMYFYTIENLIEELGSKGYIVVEPPSQVEIVRSKFKNVCIKEDKIVMDTRCPAAIEYIEERIKNINFYIPEIEPILIHSARVLYDLYIKNDKNNRLLITTPCSSLKDMGNFIFKSEGKVEVLFKTWNDICDELNIKKEEKCDKSPIPLGFFRDLNLKVLEVSGKEQVLGAFENTIKNNENIDLVEMLLCEGGCNAGDGV
ncbi:hypothetical protein [Clostridium tetanomorphum]|uniref:Iron hydrogenase large subunit C-terminal domain-containing protein n=1 Tax=Clostridium tetanomorphum TaxID=1553 RepID=A0A923IZQ0_CLOTT|nr:hypothetical protein [Clostridium tetanomorphum]MBC2397541.1 hypothetical protein [Clostridium tetanomorphum]NRZ95707.1 iron only hydrogenase large subunit-like protein [Clostridium tetanomorphum]